MKYLLSLLLILNAGPAKEQPERLTFEVHPNYTIEEMQHIDDDNEADNNESVEIINNILNK